MRPYAFTLPGIGRLAACLLAGLLCLAGCSPERVEPSIPVVPLAVKTTPIVAISGRDPAPPILVTLILSKAPKLNEPADVRLVIQSILDAPGTSAEITLPEGTQVNSGQTTWSGELKANQPVTLSANIQFTRPGNLTIQGRARSQQPNGDIWADLASIYLNVTEKAGKVGFSN